MASSHRHHSGLDKNDTERRIKHATGQGFERTLPARVVFGTEEELADRVGGSITTLPDRAATKFNQIGPKPTAGDYVQRKPKAYSGDQKFGNPRRYA